MSSTPTSGFIVHIYKSEINEIRKYQGQTRVGDLFGLWTISGNVVVQLAVGPSLCGARPESEQDLKNYLEKKHMLCHVGKWQCDPNLTSTTIAAGEPDHATLATVRSYCGNGYNACVLLILCGRGNVQPYLFLEGGTQHISGTINILSGNESSCEALNNPLRNIQAIREMLEKQNRVVQRQHLAGGHARVNAHNSNSDSWVSWVTWDGNTSPSGNPLARTQHSSPNSSNISHLNSSTSPQPVSSSSAQLSSSAGQNTSSNPTLRKCLNTSTGDKILEDVLGKICLMVGDLQKVHVERTFVPECIQLTFEINLKKCQIKFPMAFPEAPATILCNFKPLTPKKNLYTSASILSTIRSETSGHPSTKTNKTTCVQQPVPTVTSKVIDVPSKVIDVPSDKSNDSRENAIFEYSRRICKQLMEIFVITGAINMQVKDDKPGKRVELAFEHNKKKWLIVIPVEFPKKGARVFQGNLFDAQNRWLAVLSKSTRCIDNHSEIFNTIHYKCSCTKCIRAGSG